MIEFQLEEQEGSFAADAALAQRIEKTVELIYEVNRAVRRCNGQGIGVPFRELDDNKKKNLIRALLTTWSDETPIDSIEQHDRWVYDKLKDGWKFGAVEDSTEKTHPNMIPYRDLPWTEQVKDALFQVIAISAKPRAKDLGLGDEDEDEDEDKDDDENDDKKSEDTQG